MVEKLHRSCATVDCRALSTCRLTGSSERGVHSPARGPRRFPLPHPAGAMVQIITVPQSFENMSRAPAPRTVPSRPRDWNAAQSWRKHTISPNLKERQSATHIHPTLKGPGGELLCFLDQTAIWSAAAAITVIEGTTTRHTKYASPAKLYPV